MNGAPVGQNIRYFRHAKNLTQVELASKVGVAPPYISQIESGIRLPSLKVARRIAEALGLDVTVLLGSAARDPGKLAPAEKVEMLRVLLDDAEGIARHGDDGDLVELAEGVVARRLADEPGSFEISHVVIRRPARPFQSPARPGYGMVFCLKGEFTLQVGKRKRTLAPWEHAIFDSSQPHWAKGRAGTEVLWIGVPGAATGG
jgi:transcriptional regulator with XRE-family HTH domain